MKYSRFNEQLAVYDVFEDGTTHALNADFPVPKMPPAAGKIGVSARNAGRDLPPGAKPIGQSWLPVGLVVTSVPAGLGEDDSPVSDRGLKTGLVVGASLLGGYLLFRAYVRSMTGLSGGV